MEIASFSTPVLFLIFNRPENTRKVFEEISKVRPAKLYIAADGPRSHVPGDKEKCLSAREIEKKIDWKCEVKTLFRDHNLGCKNAVSSAISWFFEEEDEGIILEDDCVPDQSFFSFCQCLLATYRDNDKIMHIGGNNFQPEAETHASYYFSNYNHVWGWATWKRAWKKYDKNLQDFPAFLKEGRINKILGDRPVKYSWLYKFWKLHQQKIDTWDYQWTYTIWNNRGISVTPSKNLVSNIGFNEDATHTKSKNGKNWAVKTEGINTIIHPQGVEINHEADRRADKISYNSSYLKNFLFWIIISAVRQKHDR